MKKQNKTYLLLAVVLGIWGIIAFKFFAAANPGNTEIAQVETDAVFVPRQVKERETFTILANYRDPFLGTVQAPKKKVKKATSTGVKKKKVVPSKSIQFTGFITDKNSRQKIFFVTVDGQQQMMSAGDVFQEVKLLRGTKSAITVTHNGNRQSIALTQ